MHERTVRVAGVDMGSNTTRLIVADVLQDADGRVSHEPLLRRSTITRLAEGVDARGILLPEPITRVRNALIEYRRLAREHGAVFVLATATSAVRDADNGEAFLGEVEHGFGFRTVLLDGEQEAGMTWRGVTSDPETAARAARGSGMLVDIGGGSTELLLSRDGAVVDRHSFQLGSVRLTERFLSGAGDPPEPAAVEAARREAQAQLQERFPSPSTPDLVLAVAGTATTVSAIMQHLEVYDPDAVHGFTFTPGDLREVTARLASMPVEQRRHVKGLEPERAAVIVGGLLILECIAEWFGVRQIQTSERDILDGIALEAGRIALQEGIEALPEPFGRTCC